MRPPSLKAADFQRALGSRPVSRTTHFVLHALPLVRAADAASAGSEPDALACPAPLSTDEGLQASPRVDECALTLPSSGPSGWRLGLVLPKKQARRSVTRSLIRHQVREALRRHGPDIWAAGRHGDEVDGWVVRLKAPFDRQLFPSAASPALNVAVRDELDELWSRLARSTA